MKVVSGFASFSISWTFIIAVIAVAGVAPLGGASFRKRKVAGSIPSQGTHLGMCGFDPWSGLV